LPEWRDNHQHSLFGCCLATADDVLSEAAVLICGALSLTSRSKSYSAGAEGHLYVWAKHGAGAMKPLRGIGSIGHRTTIFFE
jgi:hypothetical protein